MTTVHDRYWCDYCNAHFTGREAIPHKGTRCYVKEYLNRHVTGDAS